MRYARKNLKGYIMINVSVLVPVYGVEKYIERCAKSLFEQTYENIEYVFVDDCGADRSIDILKQVVENYPARKTCVRIVRHERNRGLAAARNTAVECAGSDFILHVDSDDYLDLDFVEKLVTKQEENNADIVSSDCVYESLYKKNIIRCSRTMSPQKLALSCIFGNNLINIWGRLIRKSLYVENDICVKEGLNMAEDYQVISRLAFYAKEVDYIEDSFYHYMNTNENSYSLIFNEKKILDQIASRDIVYKFFRDKGEDFVVQCKKSEANCSYRDYKELVKQKIFCGALYDNVKGRIDRLDDFQKRSVPMSMRIIYALPKGLSHYYVIVAQKIKHILER